MIIGITWLISGFEADRQPDNLRTPAQMTDVEKYYEKEVDDALINNNHYINTTMSKVASVLSACLHIGNGSRFITTLSLSSMRANII